MSKIKEKVLLNYLFPMADMVMGTCAMKWYRRLIKTGILFGWMVHLILQLMCVMFHQSCENMALYRMVRNRIIRIYIFFLWISFAQNRPQESILGHLTLIVNHLGWAHGSRRKMDGKMWCCVS